MLNQAKYIIIGKFGKAHGVRGWIKIIPSTDPATAILAYKPWYLKVGSNFTLIPIDNIQPKGNKILAHLQNLNDVDTIKYYTNKDIFIERSQLPELSNNEYYWADLEGLKVINQQDITLGTISYLFTSGSSDIMVIDGEKRHLIPFLRPQFVKNIDLKQKIMLVDWDAEF